MKKIEEAYFAGGCFWCMEKPYHEIPGVIGAESGYCGGSEADARYELVKAQKTGHRETVRVAFDPDEVSFEELLAVYFYNIDPFDDGGQFIDRGRSYTCAIYYTDERQKSAAEEAIAKIGRETGKTVCVAVEPFSAFYSAEEYHQNYAEKNADAYREERIASGREARGEEERVKL